MSTKKSPTKYVSPPEIVNSGGIESFVVHWIDEQNNKHQFSAMSAVTAQNKYKQLSVEVKSREGILRHIETLEILKKFEEDKKFDTTLRLVSLPDISGVALVGGDTELLGERILDFGKMEGNS